MTTRAQELLREALSLPARERADVAAELLASLDDTVENIDEIETEWADEIARRARRVLAAQSPGIPWEEVRRRADDGLRGR